MNLEDLRKYCLSKRGAFEDYPFGDDVLVFKVGTKMFALTNVKEKDLKVSLKCEPFLAADLRREFSAVKPGYHLNKNHWNTVDIDGSMSEEKMHWMIDLSYDLVFKGLKKSDRYKILNDNK